MAKDGPLTAKAIGKKIKAKGLQKLRWFCQVCEKQCRDENGFKCHVASETHLRMMQVVASSSHEIISSYSKEFQDNFMNLLSRRYGTRKVIANHVYNEYIADRNHLHMNATQWSSLTEFIKHLGKEGLVEVEESEKGWHIKWIDRRPETLARLEATQRKERMEKTDEEVAMKLLEEQIKRAQQQSQLKEGDTEKEAVTELKRDNEEQPIKLALNVKTLAKPVNLQPKKLNMLAFGMKKPDAAQTTSSVFSSMNNSAPAMSSASSSSFGTTTKKLSAVEEIMKADIERKKRMEMAQSGGFSRDRDHHREKDRERERRDDVSKHRHRSRSRSRSRSPPRDKEKDKERRDRDYDRKERRRSRSRSRERHHRDRERDRDYRRD